jgi:hypothetical protein
VAENTMAEAVTEKLFMKTSFALSIVKFSGLLFAMDIIFTGSGAWSGAIGIPVRKICFGILCVISSLYWISEKKHSGDTIAAIFFVIFFVIFWGLLIPSITNVAVENSILDIQSIIGVIFFPAIGSMVVSKCNWDSAKKIIFSMLILLAALHIVFWIIGTYDNELGLQIAILLKLILEPLRYDEETTILIGYLDNQYRVFWGSSVCLLAGFYMSTQIGSKFFSTKKLFLMMLFVFAFFTTFTRGFLLAATLMLTVMACARFGLYKIKFGLVEFAGLGFMLFFITIPIIIFSDPSILAVIGLDRDVSDNLRAEQVQPLLAGFFSNFIFGKGFGAAVEVIRSDNSPWLYELSILALFMKCGIMGIANIILIFVLLIKSEVKKITSKALKIQLLDLYALLFAVVFASNTNPYLFNFTGLGILLFIYIEFRFALRQYGIREWNLANHLAPSRSLNPT